MRFREIVGQHKLAKRVRANIRSGRVAHAQLFEGEGGFGALAVAVAYVQYLNCTNPSEDDSCGECSSCRKIASMQHPDLHFVFPVNKSDKALNLSKNSSAVSDNFISLWREFALNTPAPLYFEQEDWFEAMQLESKTLQPVINKREADLILEKLSLKPTDSRYMMFIIWLPEKMNDSAANTLLKQFEEPVGNALFIFVTQQSHQIIKTIISRTQSITIPPIDRADILTFLQNRFPDCDADTIRSAVGVSKGNLVRAINALSADDDHQLWFEMFKQLMRSCFQNRHMELLDWVERFDKLPRDTVEVFFCNSIDILRYSYMQNIGIGELNSSFAGQRDFIAKFFPYVDSDNLEPLIGLFQEAQFHIYRNGNTKIVMTHFALSATKLVNPLKR